MPAKVLLTILVLPAVTVWLHAGGGPLLAHLVVALWQRVCEEPVVAEQCLEAA